MFFFTSFSNYYILGGHGVGHGLADILGMDGVERAIEICEGLHDLQFQYSCATGVYMELVQSAGNKPNFYPCDVARYPAACFRFRYGLVNNMITLEESDACRTQTDEYHYIGCAWGLGYASNAEPTKYFLTCKQYLPEKGDGDSVLARRHGACIDGFLSAKQIGSFPERRRAMFCTDLENYPLAYEICNRKKNNDFRTFTFSEEDEENNQYYNVDLLERDYDPSIKPQGAEFLQTWKDGWTHAQSISSVAQAAQMQHAGH